MVIPLPKKVNAVECKDYRTISLIPHAFKVMLKIIMKRIEGKAINVIGKHSLDSERAWVQGKR